LTFSDFELENPIYSSVGLFLINRPSGVNLTHTVICYAHNRGGVQTE